MRWDLPPTPSPTLHLQKYPSLAGSQYHTPATSLSPSGMPLPWEDIFREDIPSDYQIVVFLFFLRPLLELQTC